MASLACIPEDIKVEILKHLDVRDTQTLAVTHSSWTMVARSAIFRRIETNNRTNAKLGRLLHESLSVTGSLIRRLGLSFTLHFNDKPIHDADERRKWLEERDSYLGGILRQAEGLQSLCIYLFYDTFCANPDAQPQLDRSAWIGTFEALCSRSSLRTLKIALPYGAQWPMVRSIGFIDLLTQSRSLVNLTTLSLTGYAKHEGDALTSFCSFLQSLSSLRHLQLDNFICPMSALSRIVPSTITSFEYLRQSGGLGAVRFLGTLAGKPNLRHLRLIAPDLGTVSSEAYQGLPCVLPLETLSLENPGNHPERWMLHLHCFLALAKYPLLHTLCLDVHVLKVTDGFRAAWQPLVLALADKAHCPSLKLVQLPIQKWWLSELESSEFRQSLARVGIELQISDDPARRFRRFASALAVRSGREE